MEERCVKPNYKASKVTLALFNDLPTHRVIHRVEIPNAIHIKIYTHTYTHSTLY